MLLLFSCGRGVQDVGADVLVSVEGHSLLRSEVETVIPRTLSSADSLLMAESYVKKWVKDVLVYDVAEENLGEEMADVEGGQWVTAGELAALPMPTAVKAARQCAMKRLGG